MSTPSSLDLLLIKLGKLYPLDGADCAAVMALPHEVRTVEAHAYLARIGQRADHSCLVRTGFLCRSKTLTDGQRQIVSLHMTGDLVNLQNALAEKADHDVQALKQSDVTLIPG